MRKFSLYEHRIISKKTQDIHIQQTHKELHGNAYGTAQRLPCVKAREHHHTRTPSHQSSKKNYSPLLLQIIHIFLVLNLHCLELWGCVLVVNSFSFTLSLHFVYPSVNSHVILDVRYLQIILG